MFKTVMAKVDNIQGLMYYFSRDRNCKKIKWKWWKLKTQLKNIIFNSRLDTKKELVNMKIKFIN